MKSLAVTERGSAKVEKWQKSMFMWCCACIILQSAMIPHCWLLFGTMSTVFWWLKHKEITKKSKQVSKCGHKMTTNCIVRDEERSEDEGQTVSPSWPVLIYFSLRYEWCNPEQRWLHIEMHQIVIREAEVFMKRRNRNGFFLFHPRSACLCLRLHRCLCGTTSVADQRRDVV